LFRSKTSLELGGGKKKTSNNLTLIELKKKASKYNIQGRSKMNKSSLIKALSKYK
jgi:hypothetical protein